MFFEFRHNSFCTRGLAYIRSIIDPGGNPNDDSLICPTCRTYCGDLIDNYYDRDLVVQIEQSKATKWPDIIGCGSEPSFTIVSERVLEAWGAEGIDVPPCFSVRVAPPYPKTLTTGPPPYYRIDYKKTVGAELDYEASNFVGARTCETCGNFKFDLSRSYDLRQMKIYPFVLKPGTWNGKDVFSPKQPERYTFCTEKVVDCAHKYKLTNFRFHPFEIASDSWFRGVDYSKKNWRTKLPEQIQKCRDEFQERVKKHFPDTLKDAGCSSDEL